MTTLERASDGLTIAEAARQLGVHYQTVRNWLKKHDQGKPGGLPYTVFGAAKAGERGRIVRIHPDDLAPFRGRAA